MPPHKKSEYHRNALLQENCIMSLAGLSMWIYMYRISIDGKYKYFMLLELILSDKSPITYKSFCLLPDFPYSSADS